MTIDEAIEHERRVAREHGYGEKDYAYHMQLAEWLRKARGAEKAAKWHTKKIEELENRAKALANLLDESEEENDRLKRQVEALKGYAHASETGKCLEGISEQIAQIDRSIREMNSQIATGYLSNLSKITGILQERPRTC